MRLGKIRINKMTKENYWLAKLLIPKDYRIEKTKSHWITSDLFGGGYLDAYILYGKDDQKIGTWKNLDGAVTHSCKHKLLMKDIEKTIKN